MPNDRWKKDILKVADDFAREGQGLMKFASSLREAVIEADQGACLALVIAFLEQLIGRRVRGD